MTSLQYLKDAYQAAFDATIVKADKNKVILDQTCFYPSGGGQPHDTGLLKRGHASFSVHDVIKKGKDVLHIITEEGLAVGDRVHGEIDWNRRYRLMRMHTAAHIISGVVSREFNAKITGNQLQAERGRIDFDLESFSAEVITAVFEQAKEIIDKNLPLRSYPMKREDIEKDPGMVKLAIGLPPHLKVLRIIDIAGFDRQPDGGTHVNSTKEVGSIEFLKSENKGKNNRRLYFTIS